VNGGLHGVEDMMTEKFRGREHTSELRQRIEVLIVQGGQHRFQRIQRSANIDDDIEPGQRRAKERDVDDKGGSMLVLRRSEERIGHRVGDHDRVANFYGKHRHLPD
jgi:hypothetical protein